MLPIAAAAAKRRRTEAEERARHEALERERRRREAERLERAKKRRDYLQPKAREYAELERLQALARHLQRVATPDADQPVDRIARDLATMILHAEQAFEREALNVEIIEAALIADEDVF